MDWTDGIAFWREKGQKFESCISHTLNEYIIV